MTLISVQDIQLAILTFVDCTHLAILSSVMKAVTILRSTEGFNLLLVILSVLNLDLFNNGWASSRSYMFI